MPPKPRPHGPRRPNPARKPPVPGAPSARPLWLYGAAGLGLLAILAVVAFVVFGSGGSGPGDARAALEAAGCTLELADAPANVSDHSDVRSPDMDVKAWNTDPPTAGPHFGVPALFGAYDEALQQARVVNNLEHGGVYIQYGSEVPEATVAELRGFYEDHQNGTLLAPLPRLGKTIALGAWVTPGETGEGAGRGTGVLAKCTEFDREAFAAYFDAYQFKGPERFPPDALAPGS